MFWHKNKYKEYFLKLEKMLSKIVLTKLINFIFNPWKKTDPDPTVKKPDPTSKNTRISHPAPNYSHGNNYAEKANAKKWKDCNAGIWAGKYWELISQEFYRVDKIGEQDAIL